MTNFGEIPNHDSTDNGKQLIRHDFHDNKLSMFEQAKVLDLPTITS
jgi:hypothetical protein